MHFPILTKVAAHDFHSRLAPFSTFVLNRSAFPNDDRSAGNFANQREWEVDRRYGGMTSDFRPELILGVFFREGEEESDLG